MITKYYKISLILIFILLSHTILVNALSIWEKWAILDDFKQRQYQILFESNLWSISDRFSDIFDLSKKVDIYDNLTDKVKQQREKMENNSLELINQISVLEESIKQLDLDINNTMIRVDKINKSVIEISREVETNTQTITDIKRKILDNTKTLLEYLVYIYKKSNTIYNEDEIDNLKSILLNWSDISDVINDLYFKSLIQKTWKALIDNHKKYISELYMKKVNLEKKQKDLKDLRKALIIEKKVLDDKKDFKERILTVSKWKQSYYEKYIFDKLEVEKRLQLKSFKEKVKFNTIRKQILDKYSCEFVDLSKNTIESRSLTWKCLDINKMIYSESKLEEIDTLDWKNFFDWPVSTDKWISRYFHDPEYYKSFWSEHEAIDIIVNQGTPIKAPADWYVVYINPPFTEDYSYIALKHYDWYMTVYGHVSDIFVKEYDYVKKWDIFALSGWSFGTKWAWFLTTWPHLHFEVFKDSLYIDPLTVLDLSYMQYSKLDEKYRFKFYSDFKARRWYEFQSKTASSRKFKLEWNDEIERQQYLIKKYAVWEFNNWDLWIEESLNANIDPSFAMCIWLAETSLWKYLKTPYNIWNVWNTDSWVTRTYSSAREWISRMLYTLNNKYLWQYNEIRHLSRYWNYDLSKPIYASSEENWHKNIITCMSHLKWDYVPDEYNFRIITE